MFSGVMMIFAAKMGPRHDDAPFSISISKSGTCFPARAFAGIVSAARQIKLAINNIWARPIWCKAAAAAAAVSSALFLPEW